MKFGVIYDVTLIGDPMSPDPRDHNNHSIKELDPKVLGHKRGTWKRTEAGAKCVEHDYPEGCPVQGHGKWVALLTQQQFSEFVREFAFCYCSLTETMGAIGIPGSEHGYECMPAWSFDSDYYESCFVNVYVTPYPDVKIKTGASCTEKNVRRILKAMAELF